MTTRDPQEPFGLYNLLPETVRKVFVAGMGALFLTEEGIRKMIGDLKLPKELVGYVLEQADRSKRQLLDALAREVTTYLRSADVADEVRRALTGMTVSITTEVTFKPASNPQDPVKVEPHIRIKGAGRSRKKAEPEPGDGGATS